MGGERECPIDRQKERDCDVESLICNGCITQMLGVICQPGLSCRARAALGGKELDTVLSLFTPTHNGGDMQISTPILALSSLPCRGVLPSIWTAARQRRRWGGLIAGRRGEKCDISPIRSFSCHVLELEMMGCSLRPCLASLGSRGGPRSFHPLSPEGVCVRKRGREIESPLCPSVLYYE